MLLYEFYLIIQLIYELKKIINNLFIIVVIIDWFDWCVIAGYQREDFSFLCDILDRFLYIKSLDKTVMFIVFEEEI